jgi:hypothetical protein
MSEASSWRELLVLLRSGDVDCAILSCEFIGETIGNAATAGAINDLPDIFHEIITKNYVTSDDLYTRCNTAYFLRPKIWEYRGSNSEPWRSETDL